MMKEAGRFGLPQPEVGPVKFSDIAGRIRAVIEIIEKHDSVERFCKLGARVEFGRAAFVDEHSVLLNGSVFSAKNWVIATGSSPSIPPIEGLDKTPYITNREIFSLEDLPRSMIVLGAGPIAVEMSQSFARLGTEVSVVQRSNQILSKEDKDMADQLMEVLGSEGVTFYLNSTVLSVSDLGGERAVVIRSGDGGELELRAETILIAMGRVANLDGLGLEGIGVGYTKKGLKVDRRLRTTRKHVYGAGDVTGENQFTHAAGYEGGIIIANAIFHLPKKTDYTYMPWCTYTDPEFASIGMNEKRAGQASIQYSVWEEEFKDNDRSLAEDEKVGRVKMILNEQERPLGVQILGPGAGEIINEWVAVLNGGVKLSTIASAVHPYPTLGEINKRVAGAFMSKKIFSNKVRKSLKFLFNLKGRACEWEDGGTL